jgi:hypothetical protein
MDGKKRQDAKWADLALERLSRLRGRLAGAQARDAITDLKRYIYNNRHGGDLPDLHEQGIHGAVNAGRDNPLWASRPNIAVSRPPARRPALYSILASYIEEAYGYRIGEDRPRLLFLAGRNVQRDRAARAAQHVALRRQRLDGVV